MSVPDDLRELVRSRANGTCEYCGVAEGDVGGSLTVDHFRPRIRGGSDDAENLLYCCHACNSYKADYWPTLASDSALWNPRHEPRDRHLIALADGTLCPITPTGAWTIKRLRLNRSPLIAYRQAKLSRVEESRLLRRYRDLVSLLESLQQQHVALLEEHRVLLEQQRTLLRFLAEENEE